MKSGVQRIWRLMLRGRGSKLLEENEKKKNTERWFRRSLNKASKRKGKKEEVEGGLLAGEGD